MKKMIADNMGQGLLENIIDMFKNDKTLAPLIRGDAAYLPGTIGHKDALPFSLEASKDENEIARKIIHESIGLIRYSSAS